jgi:hypothetical protein
MSITTPKILYRAAAPTGSTTLYTVPASTTTIVTSIVVDNAGASTRTYTISLNGVQLYGSVSILSSATHIYNISQPLTTTQTIAGNASNAEVKFHICGVEIA